MSNEEKVITKVKCLRCGYEWFPARPGKPMTCARCRSPYWDRPRVRV